ncbi:hypothetical protein PG994_015246 [Apiospora phragmitis]|uniref:Uncharacterized protein n=1 Tax=Apiospora phragmitis TaxID=2905665 RepID=A0ABR1SQZ8_9PEZI
MRGNERVANRRVIIGNWSERFYWDKNKVLEFHQGNETVLEFRFACYSRQAENAARVLATDTRFRDVDLWFGQDPCAGL